MTHDAAALKAQIDLRDVVASLWGDPERTAPRYHTYRARWRDDGQNASFTVYPDRFKDYGGRGRSGDVYEFLQHELDLSFTEALDWLAQHTGSGNTIPARQHKATPARRPSTEPPAPAWQHAAQDALEQAQAYLWSDAPDAARVREYLRTVRGFSDATIKAAGYGYNPRWQPLDYQHPQRNYRVKLSPGIIEPWWCDGVLWALRVRRRVGNLAQWLNQPDDTLGQGDAPKYLNLAGSKQTGAMYNADTITPGGDVLVVEGGFDAQLAAQHLDDVAVVTFGSATNTPPARRIQQLKQAERVFLLLDADDAGKTAQSQLAAALDGNAYSVTLPQGNDVTEFIVEHNGDLSAVLREAAASGRVTPPTDTSADRGAWWANGVPDGVRSALLNYFRPTTAPVIELVNTAIRRGLLTAQAFTINELLHANDELGFDISAGSVRRVVSELEGYFFAELDTVSFGGKSVSKSAKNKRGRRSKQYMLLPLESILSAIVDWATPRIIEALHPTTPDDEDAALAQPTADMFKAVGMPATQAKAVAEHLREACEREYLQTPRLKRALERELARLRGGMRLNRSTELPDGWSLATAADYRAAFLRATNDEDARRSRREIQDLLGISNGSVSDMLRRAGLVRRVEGGEYEDHPITQPRGIEKQVSATARKVKGFPRAIVVTGTDGKQTVAGYAGVDSAPYIASQLKDGAQVSVRYQVANRYRPLAAPVEPVKPTERETNSSGGGATKRVYGPVHDPAWVAGQVALLLVKRGVLGYANGRYYDPQTGEIVELDNVRSLLLRLVDTVGRQVDTAV